MGSPAVGDYAYIKGANVGDDAAVYECATAGTWTDSGRTVDTSNVQTFGSGQAVNEVKIKDETGEEVQGSAGVLSAEAGLKIFVAKAIYSGYLKPTNGTLSSSNSYMSSDFVPFVTDLYFYGIYVGSTVGLCLFDKYQNFIGHYDYGETQGLQDVVLQKSSYPDVAFVRFSTTTSANGWCRYSSADGVINNISSIINIITSVYGDFFSIPDTLLKSNGDVMTFSGKYVTDFIPIDASNDIVVYGYGYGSTTYAPVCFYDGDFTCIGHVDNTASGGGMQLCEIIASNIPNGAKYIRCCSNAKGAGFVITNTVSAVAKKLVEMIGQLSGVLSDVASNTAAVETLMEDNYEDGLGEEQSMTIAGLASYGTVPFSSVEVGSLPVGTQIVSLTAESGATRTVYFYVAGGGNYPTGGSAINIKANTPLILTEACYGIKASAVDNYTITYRLPVKVSKVERLDMEVSNLEQSAPPIGKLAIEKNVTEIILYINKAGDLYYKIPIRHAVKEYDAALAESYYDVWGVKVSSLVRFNNGVFEQVYDITTSGEQEVAINTEYGNGTSGNVFVGGSTHGFDNIMTEDSIRCFSLVVDGKNIGESDLLELAPIKDFVLLQKEELCKAKSTTPVAHVEKRYSISENEIGLKLNVKFTPLDNTTHWGQGYFGMFCIKRSAGNNKYISSRLVKDNHPFHIYNVEDGWWNEDYADDLKNYDVNCSEIREYTLDYNTAYALKVTKPVSLNASIDYASMFMTYNTASSNYNKIYNMVNRGTPTLDPTRTYEGEVVFVYM